MEKSADKELSDLTTCQECGSKDPNLVKVDSGLKLTLVESGRDSIPEVVCKNCLKTLKKSASQGAQLMAKEVARSKEKNELWKVRTNIVKQGRTLMQRGDYAESAIQYEKYLKIVALATGSEKKDLDPKAFHATPKEITIIASVLWDLMLIYDNHMKFADKQMETAQILSRFLRFSPIYNAVLRKAEVESRRAKNRQAFLHLLKLCDAQVSRCFIANSAFQSRRHPTVVLLCAFRDQILDEHWLGRPFIAAYYRTSPPIASLLDQSPRLRRGTRLVLQGIAFVLARIFPLPRIKDS